jgi:hypothetical protein
MTNEETGTTALMIPALETSTELVEMAVRPAARDHLLAWDAGQRLVASLMAFFLARTAVEPPWVRIPAAISPKSRASPRRPSWFGLDFWVCLRRAASRRDWSASVWSRRVEATDMMADLRTGRRA